MKIVCFGDSLTFGYGVSKEDRWIELLKSELGIKLINRGVNGDSTTGMLSRLHTDIIKNTPTHAIIMGGTNDFIAGRNSKTVLDNITIIIEELNTNDIIPIIAIQPPIISEIASVSWAEGIDYNKVNKQIENYREAMTLHCYNSKVICADFYRHFKYSLESSNREYFIDGIHPTAKGHRIMADILLQVLR